MKEVFLSVRYVVCWAGCEIPVKDRTFDTFQESLGLYRDNMYRMDCRIEQVTTHTKIKVVHPQCILDFRNK